MTYFSDALKSGTAFSEPVGATAIAASDMGFQALAKKITLQAATATNVDGTIILPRNSQILDIVVDSSVAWTAAGAVNFTAGITAGGTEYITAIDLKTVVRGAPTLTAAQVGAMADIGTNTSVVVRANSASGANAVGTTIVTVRYVQTV
jgi:hypothetical protein